MSNPQDNPEGDAERSISDLRTVRPSSVAAPAEVSIGDLRTAQTKSRSTATAETAGDIIAGRYKIASRLGQGGMGVVYLALDQKLGREVCVKRLLADEDSASRGIDLFLQEARAIAALNHRNIVTIHELGEDEHGPFIVMEYLPGGDLRKAIHTAGKLDAAKSLPIIKAVGQGLSYAHGKGIIHRDVKPANVLLDGDGTPKLVDFGLAQLDQESDLMVTGQGMGTMAYMAPEQLRDAKHVDARSDIYALAKTLYHMLTGEVPTTVDLEMVPAEIRPALRQALKNKPEDRPASVADYLKLLSAPVAAPPALPVADTGAMRPGQCTTCGHGNPEHATFCEGCGAGLFEACPRCKAETRIGAKHCAKCGTDIADFKMARELLYQAQQNLKNHLYEQAMEQARRGLERWPGHPPGRYQAELRGVLQRAEGFDRKIKALQALQAAEVERLIQQGAYEHALRKLDGFAGTAPERESLRRLRQAAIRGMSQRDAQGNLEAARKSLQERRFDAAIQACNAVRQFDPENREAEPLLAQAQEMRNDHQQRLQAAQALIGSTRCVEAVGQLQALANDYPLDERSRLLLSQCEKAAQDLATLPRVARQAVEQKRFDKAIKACTALLELKPDDANATELLSRANALKRVHHERVERVKQMRRAYWYAEAVDQLKSLEAEFPWDDRLKTARVDFESIIRRIETLLQTARDGATEKRFDAVLQACASIRQLSPNLPEVATLTEQAEAMKHDHDPRFTEAMQLKASYAFTEAADILRKLATEYPWDTSAQTELSECETAPAQLERLIDEARAATAARKLPTALAAWQGVLALNPNHTEAKGQTLKLARKTAARRRTRFVAVAAAGLLLMAAAVVGIIAAVDHAHLTAARQQLTDREYDSARSELAARMAFWQSNSGSLSKAIDSAQHADLVAQATADADAGKLDDSAREFESAAQLAKSAQLARDAEFRFIAHMLDMADAAPSLETSQKEYDLAVKMGASVSYTDLSGARARFLKSLLDRSAAQEKAADFAGALATLKAAPRLPDDAPGHADLSAKSQELVSLAKAKDAADAEMRRASANADEGKRKSVPSDAAAAWQVPQAFDTAAAKAYEARDYHAAQEAWRNAADEYAAATRQAIAARELRSAKASFTAALQASDQNRLKQFGGAAWAEVTGALKDAETAEDLAGASAGYRRAADLLPAAVGAADAGEMRSAKSSFATALQPSDPKRLKEFGGSAWADVAAAVKQAESAKDVATALAAYRHATDLLPAAVKAADAGEVESAKSSFEAALQATQQDRLKEFGGPAWTEMVAALREVGSAKDQATALAAYRRATDLLSAAVKASASFTNSVNMKFVCIDAGSFLMGSPKDEAGHEGEFQHRVKLSKPFYMATTPVTQKQWKAVMAANPSHFKGDDLPVEMVSWDDAVKFCQNLSSTKGKKYRLPTEAEWEYCCRAGTTTTFNTGATITTDQANYDGRDGSGVGAAGKFRGKTTPVGAFQPNAWGLFDMHGNVWQWCSDGYGDYPRLGVIDPTGDSNKSSRLLRGGAWTSGLPGCRAACRYQSAPDRRRDDVGFRICLDDYANGNIGQGAGFHDATVATAPPTDRSASGAPSDPPKPAHVTTVAELRQQLAGTKWRRPGHKDSKWWFKLNADGTVTAGWHKKPGTWVVTTGSTIVAVIEITNRTPEKYNVDLAEATITDERGGVCKQIK